MVGLLDAHAQGWDGIVRPRLAHGDLSPALLRIQHLSLMTTAAEFVSQKPLNPGAESSVLALLPLREAAHMCPHLCLISGNQVHSVPVNVAAMDSGRSWETDLCSKAAPGVWVVSISPKLLGCT